jgi:nuclear transport factor 2 (NTF2) superfamily protein
VRICTTAGGAVERLRVISGPPLILPPFDEESARRKVQVAQDAWNTRDPERVALAYRIDASERRIAVD